MEEKKIPYDKFIGYSDVAEEIRVFPNYIQYNTWCGPAWIDYAKYEYKIEGEKLYIKAFEYAYVDFEDDYEETDKFYLVKDGKFDSDVAMQYIKWCLRKKGEKDYSKDFEDLDRELAEDVINNAKSYMEWHEFKYIEDERYSRKARNRIIKKVKNKDYDL